jgi:hypothetical protein
MDIAKLDSIIAKARMWRRHSHITITDMAALDLIEALAEEVKKLQDHKHGGPSFVYTGPPTTFQENDDRRVNGDT